MALKQAQKDLDGNHNPIEEKVLLKTKFLIPPFSVLDTKSGDWLDRRNKWLNLTGDLELSRENTLYGFSKAVASGNTSDINKRMNDIGSTSHFDPALCEIIYKWFNPTKGKILDPFGGEQTKGVVAGLLGYPYTAIEFRQEQVNVNNDKCKTYPNVKYYCGNSEFLSNIITEDGFDLCFTSPPYYDLEVYSKEDASAMGTYEDFMWFYYKVFKQVMV